ncbi:putative RNA-binding protein 19 [Glandiceps talaboti]
MSRIIVKNLPKGFKEERFQNLFSSQGEVTDVQLKYTNNGVFRQFGFIGYKTQDQAVAALKFYNNSFIDSSKIQVEIAKSLTDDKIARPWSKYSQRQKVQEQINKEKAKEMKGIHKTDSATDKTQKKEKKKKPAILEELEDDPEFQEFLDTHKKRNLVQAWSNDASVKEDTVKTAIVQKKKTKSKEIKFEDDGEDDSEEEEEIFDVSKEDQETKNTEVEDTAPKAAHKSAMTDMDYLKSKVVKSKLEDDSESGEDEQIDSPKKEEAKKQKKKKKKKNKSEDNDRKTFTKGEFVVKMKGIPFSAQKKDVREFMAPIELTAVRIPKNKHGKKLGSAFVEFISEEDLKEAMKRHKDFMKGRCIELIRDKTATGVDASKMKTGDDRPWMKKLAEENEDELIGESGRLFVRNLAYVCTEEDLDQLFNKYGPLTEVYIPIDSLTKKTKGFAFVTFMMPEHAVTAYTELDGSVFQGRMLHILPSKEKKSEETVAGDETSYKKQKKAKDKALSGSSHNWNTLFIGANAVADAMAEKYNTSKSEVLDTETANSLAVRMALGETQIVSETRQFLVDNHVSLDAFSQAAAQRSNTVILVKNLPASTKPEELRKVFSKFGQLGRVLLPSAGATAIVEFLEQNEAKLAFRKLAYTKFQHVPLYLEWAPVGVFTTAAVERKKKPDQEQEGEDEEQTQETKAKESDMEISDESDDEPEEGCTLFVKNINFETREDTLKEKFSICGPLRNVSISKKKDIKQPGQYLSMGYGFVEYRRREDAQKAMKELQHCTVDEHQLELKLSNRATVQVKPKSAKKKQVTKKQKTTKILVRNLPFEATKKEIRELFSVFGEIKSIRLPKKAAGTGTHRGFGFVDFITKPDAKRAFNALCHSTHLYGRRLVLEWADTDDDSIEALRKKTAAHFHDGGPAKKFKKSTIMDDLLKASEKNES